MKCLKLILCMYFFACLSCQNQMDGEKDEELSQPDPEETADPEVMVDPEAAAIMEKLLGKWELFLVSLENDPSGPPFTTFGPVPNGYVEYLPDGSFRWYDYDTREYISYERKFWVDHVLNPPSIAYPDTTCISISDGWVLHYEPFLVYDEKFETELVYQYFKDKPMGIDFNLIFLNQDTMLLYDTNHYFYTQYYFFYKRIN